ncbi:hypothetical protein T492DRAFT_249385 [Pavlovales sp. CCMP2436]|nr:hypothetical protein T492DRAFT_249385 [Pavlovales sp. CCMP2436]
MQCSWWPTNRCRGGAPRRYAPRSFAAHSLRRVHSELGITRRPARSRLAAGRRPTRLHLVLPQSQTSESVGLALKIGKRRVPPGTWRHADPALPIRRARPTAHKQRWQTAPKASDPPWCAAAVGGRARRWRAEFARVLPLGTGRALAIALRAAAATLVQSPPHAHVHCHQEQPGLASWDQNPN